MFTRMDESTQEEWQHISEEHMPHIFRYAQKDTLNA